MSSETKNAEVPQEEQVVSLAEIKNSDRLKAVREASRGGESRNLDLVEIFCANENNVREDSSYNDDEFEELVHGIETAGGLLQPLHVVAVEPSPETNNRKYALHMGYRRFNALLRLVEKDPAYGKDVPVIVREVEDDATFRILQILENKHKQLTPIEIANAVEQLVTDPDVELSQKDVAGMMGLSESAISQRRRLLTLPERVQQWINSGEIPYKSARLLAYRVPADQVVNMAKIALRLSPNDFEERINRAYGEGESGDGSGKEGDTTRQRSPKTVTPKELSDYYEPYLRSRVKEADAEKKVYTEQDLEKARLDAVETILKKESTTLGENIAPYIEKKVADSEREKKQNKSAKSKSRFFKTCARRAEQLFKSAPADPNKQVSVHDFFVEVYSETKKKMKDKKFVDELGFNLDMKSKDSEDKFMEEISKAWSEMLSERNKRAKEKAEKEAKEKAEAEKEAKASGK